MTLSPRSIGVLALAALAAGAPPAHAQSQRVGVVTAVHGEATLSRVSLPQPTTLRRRDDVFLADRITTGDRSFTRLLLGGKALVTVRERSTLTITEAPGTSVVDLASGAVAVAVVKERMNPGETVEIRTPHAVAGIRGTVVIAEVGGTGDRPTTTITVLRGLVEVRPLDGASRHPLGPGVLVGPAQMVRITSVPTAGRPVPMPVQPLTPEVRQRLGVEWKGSLGDLPAATPSSVVETQKQEATAQVQRVLQRREEEDRKARAAEAPAGEGSRAILAGTKLTGGGSGSGSSGSGGSSGPSLTTSTLSGGSSAPSLGTSTLSTTSSGSSLLSGSTLSGSSTVGTTTLSTTSSGSSLLSGTTLTGSSTLGPPSLSGGSSGPSLSSGSGSGGSSGSSGSSSLTGGGTSGSNSGSGLGLTRILSPLLPGK